MKKLSTAFATLALAGALLSGGAAYAGTTDCTDGSVLSFIDHRFDDKARRYLQTDLDITGFDRVSNTHVDYRNETQPIQRVYCHAKVDMNDGHRRDLWYMIESGMGFAGLGDRVRFCISGLDPWYVDGRECRSVR
ncbi:hypothetical protein [Rhizobium sp. C1]|uniref:hypothetical protein n=1 Tax=Rhizobium sp. C1 TaxID=1349799 RepID=UPI001E3C3430|nr:hypothetical protein [Rhizobium sp. C1]MCD2177689.1 hypothetical protein [Rhizobium sp. C1]